VNRHWDVIVVGARVAGAATAMLLARGGLYADLYRTQFADQPGDVGSEPGQIERVIPPSTANTLPVT